jgi:hypothetical protein
LTWQETLAQSPAACCGLPTQHDMEHSDAGATKANEPDGAIPDNSASTSVIAATMRAM